MNYFELKLKQRLWKEYPRIGATVKKTIKILKTYEYNFLTDIDNFSLLLSIETILR